VMLKIYYAPRKLEGDVTYPTRGKDKGKAKEVLWKKGPVPSSESMAWKLLWRDMIRPLLEREGKRKVTVEVTVENAEDNTVEAKLRLPFKDGDEFQGSENADPVAKKKEVII